MFIYLLWTKFHPLPLFTPSFLFPQSDQYLHRVGRAGRFGTKGLAISFISRPEDEAEMQKVCDLMVLGFEFLECSGGIV